MAKRTREASSSASYKRTRLASSSIRPWNYDIFLSFTGEATVKTFADRLRNALVQRRIRTFRDDGGLGMREAASSEVLKVIEESRISIIVFSRNYASSSWCLDELLKVFECKRTMDQTVLPVFYDVDPSDVRKQSGIFAEAFADYEREQHFNAELMGKLQRWRQALTDAANLSGWDLRDVANGREAKFIQRIVDEVSTKLNKMMLDVAIYPVGIDLRIDHIHSLLSVGSDDVRIIGIWGMGGIGKTTIAKVVYNLIFHKFEGSSFLENVSEVSQQHNGLVQLQGRLLSDILMRSGFKISNIARGINLIRERLCYRRVLLVLDDVDEMDQLKALAREHNWFGPGSRIIITTRDDHLLDVLQVDKKYKVKKLNHDESLELFSWHAFKSNHPIEGYVELSNRVLHYIKGLPLALEVLGSSLLDKKISEWETVLEKLENIPPDQVQKKLRISFDLLDDKNRDIFLDIACFFVGKNKDNVTGILDGCGFFPEIGISDLVSKSLLKINLRNELRMHNLIRDMGREIVREESPEEPGNRSRLWCHVDAHSVLTKHKATDVVEGLILENTSMLLDVHLSTEAFEKMHKLRLLQLNYINLMGNFEHLSKELRWLCWHGFPLKSIPDNFSLKSVVVLDMQYSKFKQVWKGVKVLENLKVLNLGHSCNLTQTPDFSKCRSLEILIFENCTNLVEIHHSIGNLNKLAFLNLKGCKNLRHLPRSICALTSLEDLILSSCSRLGNIPSEPSLSSLWSWIIGRKGPDFITQLPISFSNFCFLEVIDISCCNLLEGAIPSDLGSLSLLKILDLSSNSFSNLPASMSNLSKLKNIILENCKNLQSIPDLPSSLQALKADGCTSLESISSLEHLTSLGVLTLEKTNFCTLPPVISQLNCLEFLNLNECPRLQSIPDLPSSLLFLYLNNCPSIENLELSKLQFINKLHLLNCKKLAQIQLPDCLECGFSVDMGGCSNLTYTSKENLFKLLEGTCDWVDVMLPGSEVPYWFCYQTVGSVISFKVSPVADHKIEGLIICAVFVLNEGSYLYGNFVPYAKIINKAKDLEWEIHPKLNQITPGACIWMGYRTHMEKNDIPNFAIDIGNWLEARDQIEVSIVAAIVWKRMEVKGRLKVLKCGVHLVYASDDDLLSEEEEDDDDDGDEDDAEVLRLINSRWGRV